MCFGKIAIIVIVPLLAVQIQGPGSAQSAERILPCKRRLMRSGWSGSSSPFSRSPTGNPCVAGEGTTKSTASLSLGSNILSYLNIVAICR